MYHKWRSYNVWFLRYKVQQSFLPFWVIFCPLINLTTWKIKILKKIKKISGEIIILHLCTRHGVQQTEFFVILDHLLPFYPSNPENQIFTTMEKLLKISQFYTSLLETMIMCYTVPEIWCMTNAIFIFHFGLFFALLPPKSPKNQNLKKNWKQIEKNAWRYHHFTHAYQKLWSDDVKFLKYHARQMDGQMDRWKKRHIKVGAPPKNTMVTDIAQKSYKALFPFWSFMKKDIENNKIKITLRKAWKHWKESWYWNWKKWNYIYLSYFAWIQK